MASCMKDQLNKIKWGKEMKRPVCRNESKYVISLPKNWERIDKRDLFVDIDIVSGANIMADFGYTNNNVNIYVKKDFNWNNCRVILLNINNEFEFWQFPKERYDDALNKCQQLIDKYSV